jgi:hypothetical protein
MPRWVFGAGTPDATAPLGRRSWKNGALTDQIGWCSNWLWMPQHREVELLVASVTAVMTSCSMTVMSPALQFEGRAALRVRRIYGMRWTRMRFDKHEQHRDGVYRSEHASPAPHAPARASAGARGV